MEGHFGRAAERRRPRPVVHVAPEEPLPGQEDRVAREGGGPFARNRVRLLLAGFGHQIMHVQRAVLELATLCVFRTTARFTVSGRRITMTTGGASTRTGTCLSGGLATLHRQSG